MKSLTCKQSRWLVAFFSCLFLLVFSNSLTTHAFDYEEFRPAGEEGRGFEELQEINPDVFGWITVFGTNIDYPLLQGEDNFRYLDHNARGLPALTGAIFMDVRNDNDFSNFNHIIYGHDMNRDIIFGAIGDFGQEQFFNDREFGLIYTGERHYGIEFFAFLLVDAYDQEIYSPTLDDPEEQQALIDRLFDEAIQSRDIDVTTSDRLVILSTCTPTVTNGRHILVGRLIDEIPQDPFPLDRLDVELFGLGFSLTHFVIGISIALVLIGIAAFFFVRRIKRIRQLPIRIIDHNGKKKYRNSIWLDAFFLLMNATVIVAVAILLFTFVFGATQVRDSTMAPAVREGDIVFFQRMGTQEFVSGDLVVVQFEGNTQVRRVVAVAGDTVDITYNGLEVNGMLMQELHIFEETTQFADIGITFPVVVPEGRVFVLGDSRTRATDSRVYGPILIEDTLGGVVTFIRRRNL